MGMRRPSIPLIRTELLAGAEAIRQPMDERSESDSLNDAPDLNPNGLHRGVYRSHD